MKSIKKHKKYLTIGILIILIGMIFPNTVGVNVEKSNLSTFIGNILYVGGSGPGNYSTIQSAIDDALNGDTIFVYDDSSPYYEHLFVDKSLNIVGENRHTTVIDACYAFDGFFITADMVNISGFTIRNSGGVVPAGIKVRSDYNNISGNIIKDNPKGIWIEDGHYNNITDNILSNNEKFGVFCYQARNNHIINNSIDNGLKYGVYLFIGANVNTVSGNIITNYDEGIYISDSTHHIITDNKISDCNRGIVFGTSDNVISGNDITDITYSAMNGIICDSVITKNRMINTDNAINLNLSLRNEISFNDIRQSVKGIYLRLSYDNEIICNNFINIFRNVFFENCRNNWNQNFWRRGRSLPKLILGGKWSSSIGYTIPCLEVDWHPASEPYNIFRMGGL